MGSKNLSANDASLSIIVALFTCQLGTAILIALFQVGYSLIQGTPVDSTMFSTSAIWYAAICIIMYSFMLITFLIFNSKKQNQIVAKPTIKKVIFYIALGLILNFLLTPITDVVDHLLDLVKIPNKSIGYELDTANFIISVFSLAILPAVFEELLFRGLVLKAFKKYGKAFSITLSTLAFCLFHLSIRQTIYPILFGLVLGLVMYEENNIIYCTILHFTNNFVTLLLSYLNFSININIILYTIIAVVLAVAFLIVILTLMLKNSNKTNNTNGNQNYKTKLTKSEKTLLAVSFVILATTWIISNII